VFSIKREIPAPMKLEILQHSRNKTCRNIMNCLPNQHQALSSLNRAFPMVDGASFFIGSFIFCLFDFWQISGCNFQHFFSQWPLILQKLQKFLHLPFSCTFLVGGYKRFFFFLVSFLMDTSIFLTHIFFV
jgi:hypothetical protein